MGIAQALGTKTRCENQLKRIRVGEKSSMSTVIEGQGIKKTRGWSAGFKNPFALLERHATTG